MLRTKSYCTQSQLVWQILPFFWIIPESLFPTGQQLLISPSPSPRQQCQGSVSYSPKILEYSLPFINTYIPIYYKLLPTTYSYKYRRQSIDNKINSSTRNCRLLLFFFLLGVFSALFIFVGMAAGGEKGEDFYAVLGLKKECSEAELRNAYKKLALVRIEFSTFFFL